MKGNGAPAVPIPGSALRLLPILSVLAFVVLVLAVTSAYEREAENLINCEHIWTSAACAARMNLFAALAGIWTIAAASVTTLMAAEIWLVRRSLRLEIPPRSILASGLFLMAFGILGFFVNEEAGFGRLPHAAGDAFFYAYLTASVVLFALAFVDYRPRPTGIDASAMALASVHGMIGLALAVLYACAVVNPPVT